MPAASPRRGLPAILAALLVFFLARPAHAGVELDVGSILGDLRTEGELLVRVRNQEDRALQGVLTIEDRTPEARVFARAPFVVGAASTSYAKVPLAATYAIDLTAIAHDASGTELGRASSSSRSSGGGYVFLEIPSPGGRWLSPFHVEHSRSGGVPLTKSPINEATGATILPDRPSSYAHVALVLVAASDLEALDAAARDVLLGWVKGGGALAVAVRDPSDLTRPALVVLVGAGVQTTPFEGRRARQCAPARDRSVVDGSERRSLGPGADLRPRHGARSLDARALGLR